MAAMSRLDRFREAQRSPYAGYDAALGEIRGGGKHGHWIWYIFPQISGLGRSGLSETFGIDGEDEAIEFLRDTELRSRLLEITTAVSQQLRTGATPLHALMGSRIDAKKLVSSLTLFGHAARKLEETEPGGPYGAFAAAADEVLAIAAAQGYPPCGYTLSRLR